MWPNNKNISIEKGDIKGINGSFLNTFCASFSEWIPFGDFKLRIVTSFEVYPENDQKLYIGIELEENYNQLIDCSWNATLKQDDQIIAVPYMRKHRLVSLLY